MKIALAGMGHESNTFNKYTTGLETFTLLSGDDFRQKKHKNSSVDGIYDTLLKSKADVIPLFFANAIPSGTIRADAYEYIKSRIIDALCKNQPNDGICLALHGSMAVEGINDPEGDLLEAIRQITGHEIPIICSLDMHATVTERMVILADGYTVFRTAPHIDSFETGVRAAEMMLKAQSTSKKPVNVFTKIPLLISGEQSETRVDPAKKLFESLNEYDKQPGVLCSSYIMGFPWADSPFGGAGALVTGWHDNTNNLKKLAEKMANIFWEKRADFTFSTPAMTPEQAIQTAISATVYPVIISDSADNPTAGASQDTTQFLRLMIESDLNNALYTCVADPEAYNQCTNYKPNETFTLTFGGYYSGKEYERFTTNAKLINLSDSEGTLYAILQSNNITFTISNKRCATYDPETLRDIGIEPEGFNTISIKAGYLSPEFQEMSKKSILALTDGDTALNLAGLPYVKTPRPIYPLDPDMDYIV